MKMQLSMFIVLFGLIEMIEYGQSYKFVRPYKFYNRNPWRPPRWHPTSSKYYSSKKIPPRDYHSYDPDHRYAPHYENWMATSDDNKPYIIVIQLPGKNEKNKSLPYQRHHIGEASDYRRDNDYIDDDDNELKVYQLDKNGVRIKINNRLSVLA